MLYKYHKIMEKFWLVAAILSLLFAAYRIGASQGNEEPLEDNLVFLLLPLIAGFLYTLRRSFRRRLEREQNLPSEGQDE